MATYPETFVEAERHEPHQDRTKAILKQLRESVSVLRFPEMVSRSVYRTPRIFGRPSSRLDRKGFSDHYPIAVMLREDE